MERLTVKSDQAYRVAQSERAYGEKKKRNLGEPIIIKTRDAITK